MKLVLLNGVIVGSIYGVFALGLTIIYKGSRVVNFAHGEFGMVGAYVLFELYAQRHWPVGVGVALALATAVALALATQLAVVRPLVRTSPVVAFVATLGVGGFLQLAAQDVFDPSLQFFPPLVTGTGVRAGGLLISASQLLAFGTAAIVTAAVYVLYQRTPAGLRMRAVAQNPGGATLLGVDAEAVSTLTWAIGGLLSGIAAVLIAPLVTFQVYFMFFLLARALAASMLGGLTSLAGAFVGGIALGVAEAMVTRYTTLSGGVEVGLFAFVLLLLLLRPRGLFGAEY